MKGLGTYEWVPIIYIFEIAEKVKAKG